MGQTISGSNEGTTAYLRSVVSEILTSLPVHG